MALLPRLVRWIGQLIFRPWFLAFSLVISLLAALSRLLMRLNCILTDVYEMGMLAVACLFWVLRTNSGALPSPMASFDPTVGSQPGGSSPSTSPLRTLTRRASFRRKVRSARRGQDDVIEATDPPSDQPQPLDSDPKNYQKMSLRHKLREAITHLRTNVMQRVQIHRDLSLSSCLFPHCLTACSDPKLFSSIYEATNEVAGSMRDDESGSSGAGVTSNLGCGFHPRLASILSSLSCLTYESKPIMDLVFPSRQNVVFHSFKVEQIRGFVAANGGVCVVALGGGSDMTPHSAMSFHALEQRSVAFAPYGALASAEMMDRLDGISLGRGQSVWKHVHAGVTEFVTNLTDEESPIIWVTGHGEGGALAVLVAHRLALETGLAGKQPTANGLPRNLSASHIPGLASNSYTSSIGPTLVDQCVDKDLSIHCMTFGAPRCVNSVLAEEITSRISCWSVRQKVDKVATLPVLGDYSDVGVVIDLETPEVGKMERNLINVQISPPCWMVGTTKQTTRVIQIDERHSHLVPKCRAPSAIRYVPKFLTANVPSMYDNLMEKLAVWLLPSIEITAAQSSSPPTTPSKPAQDSNYLKVGAGVSLGVEPLRLE